MLWLRYPTQHFPLQESRKEFREELIKLTFQKSSHTNLALLTLSQCISSLYSTEVSNLLYVIVYMLIFTQSDPIRITYLPLPATVTRYTSFIFIVIIIITKITLRIFYKIHCTYSLLYFSIFCGCNHWLIISMGWNLHLRTTATNGPVVYPRVIYEREEPWC
jgi:hypothetical protein